MDKKPLASLDNLQKKIDDARHKRVDRAHTSPPTGASYGMRVGLDLVSGFAVGTGIGYALDYWLGTLPWLSLFCMMLGIAAGVKLMMDTARKAAASIEKTEDNIKEKAD